MRTVTLTLPNEQPISWNKMYAGLHWSKRQTEARRVHLEVRVALDPDEALFDKPVAITVWAYFKNKRVQLDCSNIAAKLYEDGLIGWLIEDDSPQYVRSMTTISLIDRENPRVEIEIKEVDCGN
jgi:Holliday junction resolvase RusA-like endonuclease